MPATFCARLSVCGWAASLCFLTPLFATDDLPLGPGPAASQSTVSHSTSQVEVQSPSQPERPAHLIALRVSAGILAARINRDIDGQRAVSDVVLGTPVTGTGRLTGKLRMVPVPSPDKACFNAVFDGAIYCRTIGHNPQVTVHSHSITRFTASKEIVFDPGKGFYALPTKVAASSQSFTDSINPKRGGLIGRIIHRRAAEQVAAERPEVTAIIRRKAIERINDHFDEFMNEELAQLNQAVEIQTRLANLPRWPGSRKLVARTTPAFIEIADAIAHGSSPAAPLNLPPSGQSGSPIELWIHGSLLPETLITPLKTIFSSPDDSVVLQALAAWPGPLAQETAAAIRNLLTENKLAVQEVGDWVVIDINTPPANNAVATTMVPPTARR